DSDSCERERAQCGAGAATAHGFLRSSEVFPVGGHEAEHLGTYRLEVKICSGIARKWYAQPGRRSPAVAHHGRGLARVSSPSIWLIDVQNLQPSVAQRIRMGSVSSASATEARRRGRVE